MAGATITRHDKCTQGQQRSLFEHVPVFRSEYQSTLLKNGSVTRSGSQHVHAPSSEQSYKPSARIAFIKNSCIASFLYSFSNLAQWSSSLNASCYSFQPRSVKDYLRLHDILNAPIHITSCQYAIIALKEKLAGCKTLLDCLLVLLADMKSPCPRLQLFEVVDKF